MFVAVTVYDFAENPTIQFFFYDYGMIIWFWLLVKSP